MIRIQELSDEYDIRRLKEQDIPDIHRICCSNPQFYLYSDADNTPGRIREDMHALPPGMKPDDKYYIGFFQNSSLHAVIFIGFLKYFP